VPTIHHQLLLYFPGVGSDRHSAVHFHVTTDPTTEWTAQQLRDAVRFDRMRPYRCGIPWLLLERRIRRRPLRGCSRV